jgi:dTDP-L-rhamnose 4-epimerase
MRILVTGGAGFIGSAIVDALVAVGVRVRVLDALLPAAHGEAPQYLNASAEYRWGDCADREVVADAVLDVDAVCHQAARVGLGVDFSDVGEYVDNNDRGTAELLRALYRRRFGGRFVLASSMVVYGEGAYRCLEHGPVIPGIRRVVDLDAGRFDPPCPRCGATLIPELVGEDAPLDPRNVYAATKLHQEHLVAAFARETGSSWCALRYHNVYGPRMPRDTPYAGVASIFRSAYESGLPPAVFEDGGQRRDFVHVHDVARANCAALLSEDLVSGAFNVGSGEVHSILDVAEALRRGCRNAAPAPVVTGAYRLGDVRHVTASTERAADDLGFRAMIGFAEGMAGFATAPLREAATVGVGA